ncbi:MAG: shikimate kinase [uncultured archaeon A07HR60]|nr:MAG: shikimate kinase [uncultured archaeon A07HR60]
MDGAAVAPGAGTVLNALATGMGSAFAIDLETRAEVHLEPHSGVTGEIRTAPDADTALIERCVSLTVDRYGDDHGGQVVTDSDIPLAGGLKSSSAAANATVLATLDALGIAVQHSSAPDESPAAEASGKTDSQPGDDGEARSSGGAEESVSRLEACRIGVAAARDTGVTVTGAFDDATASMLGGVTVTDNDSDRLLSREVMQRDVLVWTPPERAYSADADVERCAAVAPVADTVAQLARDGRYGSAMTVNGLAFSAALGFSPDPALEALPHVAGVSLSGTGPSVVAVGEQENLDQVRERWEARPGVVRQTQTDTDGARIRSP